MTSCIGEELEKFFPELAVEAAVPRIWIPDERAITSARVLKKRFA
jgi:hypothetical protein